MNFKPCHQKHAAYLFPTRKSVHRTPSENTYIIQDASLVHTRTQTRTCANYSQPFTVTQIIVSGN
jgi:hypothetical protein